MLQMFVKNKFPLFDSVFNTLFDISKKLWLLSSSPLFVETFIVSVAMKLSLISVIIPIVQQSQIVSSSGNSHWHIQVHVGQVPEKNISFDKVSPPLMTKISYAIQSIYIWSLYIF